MYGQVVQPMPQQQQQQLSMTRRVPSPTTIQQLAALAQLPPKMSRFLQCVAADAATAQLPQLAPRHMGANNLALQTQQNQVLLQNRDPFFQNCKEKIEKSLQKFRNSGIEIFCKVGFSLRPKFDQIFSPITEAGFLTM